MHLITELYYTYTKNILQPRAYTGLIMRAAPMHTQDYQNLQNTTCWLKLIIDLDCLNPSMKKWVQDILNSRACQKAQSEDFCDIQPWRNK